MRFAAQWTDSYPVAEFWFNRSDKLEWPEYPTVYIRLAPMELTTVLTSGVVAGLVAGLVSLRTSERKIQIDNITQERAKWREKIRATAITVHKAVHEGNGTALSEARLTFQLLLNPFDSEDMGIIESITALMQTPDPKPPLPEFAGRVAYLLKHDWERAKYEACAWAFGLKRPKREVFRAAG